MNANSAKKNAVAGAPAPLLRRLAAMLYDALLVLAVLILAAALVFAIQGGRAPPTDFSWYTLYLIAVVMAFFVGFWCYGGQTLGMRAWRIQLRSADGGPISPAQACARMFAAILSMAPAGLGYLWQLVDADSRSWHDRLSGTKVITIEPLAKNPS